MKRTRKVLALLLALVMAMSAICISAFAAQKKQYQSYIFFGDSVTTGFGLQSYSDVAEEGGTAEGKRVVGAYPDLVAKGVGIDENNENYYNEAHSGWRTSELRETLDPSYNNDDGQFAKALSAGMANGKALADPQDPELQKRVREGIAKSDLITIDLGSKVEGTNVMINLTDPGWCRTDLGGPHAPNAPESAIPGIAVGAFVDDKKSGRYLNAPHFTGMTIEEAVKKAEALFDSPYRK